MTERLYPEKAGYKDSTKPKAKRWCLCHLEVTQTTQSKLIEITDADRKPVDRCRAYFAHPEKIEPNESVTGIIVEAAKVAMRLIPAKTEDKA